ncbi:MAG: nitroreductase family protein [Betaproteobacteria bacterium]
MIRKLARRLIDLAEPSIAKVFSINRTLARLYFGLLSPRFSREQFVVLRGRARFQMGPQLISNPRLRRNIHRLEKGLLMQPRAKTFAADYALETVAAFRTASLSQFHDGAELAWSNDVLREYFEVFEPTPEILEARRIFESIRNNAQAPNVETPPKVPHPRALGVRSNIEYDQFLALCQQRRSIGCFNKTNVPIELIERAVRAAAEAPSACNRQPFLFRLIDEPAEASSIAGLAMGTRGYSEQVPALVVVIGDFSSFALERDRHLPYIDSALASMQFMLALETLGLASCPINWPDIESLERRMSRRLELPDHLRPVLLIAVGYPNPQGGVAHSEKKPVSLLLRSSNDYRD